MSRARNGNEATVPALHWTSAQTSKEKIVSRKYAVIGVGYTQTTELIARLAAGGPTNRAGGGRRACLDLRTAVTVVLFYLRRNLAQAAIAELFGISQPTVSR
jgi:hypothetical protein